MLPLVPGFTSEVIDAARRERRTGPLELPVHTAAQPQAGRGTERDADDVLEHRAVLVPANAGTGSVANDQRLHDLARRQPRQDRKSVVQGTRVSVRVAIGGRRILQTTTHDSN